MYKFIVEDVLSSYLSSTLWRHVQSKCMDPIEDYMDGNIYRVFYVTVYYSITNLLIMLLVLARPAHDTNK